MQQTNRKFTHLCRTATVAFACIAVLLPIFNMVMVKDGGEGLFPSVTPIIALTIGILLAMCFAFASYWLHGLYTKCPKCKVAHAMKTTAKEIVSRRETSIKEKPNGVETYVPAIETIYHIHRKCKHCENEDYIQKIETKKK